jgi:2-methylcitrate dehydratase PrpD
MTERARYLDVLAEFAAELDAENVPGSVLAFTAAFPAATPARITVRLSGGGVRQAEVRHAHGDPVRPLDDVALRAKFQALTEGVLGVTTADTARAILDVADVSNVRSITARLRGASAAS